MSGAVAVGVLTMLQAELHTPKSASAVRTTFFCDPLRFISDPSVVGVGLRAAEAQRILLLSSADSSKPWTGFLRIRRSRRFCASYPQERV